MTLHYFHRLQRYSFTTNEGITQLQQFILKMSIRDLLLASSRKQIGEQSQASAILCQLVERIDKISSSVNLDSTGKNLNIFQMDKTSHYFKDDPVTKLRNLENKSEINRAELELMSQRRPKNYSIKNRYREDNAQQTYINIYKKLQNEKVFKDKNDTEITSEEEILETNEQPPPRVRHFTQLRQHPKILQYTLDRLKDKSPERKKELMKEESKLEIRSASRPSSMLGNSEFKQIMAKALNLKRDDLDSPKAIVDNQISKFYSKSSKGKLDVKIKENPRCIKLLQSQEKIVNQLEECPISKENMKKLKERLNVLVNEINRSDKRSVQSFPRITPSQKK